MRDCVRRDQGLKVTRVDVINKSYFFVMQVEREHIVEDVEARRTVAGQLDDNLLLL